MKRVPGKFIVSSANGSVVAVITNVVVGHGRVEFEHMRDDLAGKPGLMSDDELLLSFLEGRAFRLGEV